MWKTTFPRVFYPVVNAIIFVSKKFFVCACVFVVVQLSY